MAIDRHSAPKSPWHGALQTHRTFESAGMLQATLFLPQSRGVRPKSGHRIRFVNTNIEEGVRILQMPTVRIHLLYPRVNITLHQLTCSRLAMRHCHNEHPDRHTMRLCEMPGSCECEPFSIWNSNHTAVGGAWREKQARQAATTPKFASPMARFINLTGLKQSIAMKQQQPGRTAMFRPVT